MEDITEEIDFQKQLYTFTKETLFPDQFGSKETTHSDFSKALGFSDLMEQANTEFASPNSAVTKEGFNPIESSMDQQLQAAVLQNPDLLKTKQPLIQPDLNQETAALAAKNKDWLLPEQEDTPFQPLVSDSIENQLNAHVPKNQLNASTQNTNIPLEANSELLAANQTKPQEAAALTQNPSQNIEKLKQTIQSPNNPQIAKKIEQVQTKEITPELDNQQSLDPIPKLEPKPQIPIKNLESDYRVKTQTLEAMNSLNTQQAQEPESAVTIEATDQIDHLDQLVEKNKGVIDSKQTSANNLQKPLESLDTSSSVFEAQANSFMQKPDQKQMAADLIQKDFTTQQIVQQKSTETLPFEPATALAQLASNDNQLLNQISPQRINLNKAEVHDLTKMPKENLFDHLQAAKLQSQNAENSNQTNQIEQTTFGKMNQNNTQKPFSVDPNQMASNLAKTQITNSNTIKESARSIDTFPKELATSLPLDRPIKPLKKSAAFQSIEQSSQTHRPDWKPLQSLSKNKNPNPAVNSAIDRIVEHTRIFSQKGGGIATINFSDDPTQQLQINIQVNNNDVSLKIVSNSENVKDVLTQELATLAENLTKQNINVTEIDIQSHKQQNSEQLSQQNQQTAQQFQMQKDSRQEQQAQQQQPTTQQVAKAQPQSGLKPSSMPKSANSTIQVAV